MIVRNSLTNLIRARGKTALFFALIAILTLLIGLDASIRRSVADYLDACEQNFNTIGVIEYMGAAYPDERVRDAGVSEAAGAVDALGLSDAEGVMIWDKSARTLGYTDGFTRTDRAVFDKNRAVFVIRASLRERTGLMWADVRETLYSYTDRDNDVMFIEPDGYATLESGHYYLVCGSFFDGPSSYTYFALEPFRALDARYADLVCVDITDESAKKGYTLPENTGFHEIADTIRVLNNSLDVTATRDVEALLPFHQGEVYLTQGQGFTDEAYTTGAKVCLVSESLANKLGLSVGDTLPLSLLAAEGAAAYDAFRASEGFVSTCAYTIVGLLYTPDTMRHCVYVPAGGADAFDGDALGYTLATVRLQNGEADAFYRYAAPKLPDRVRLTVYDQGYAAAEKPFREVLRITNIVSAVCLLAGVCVMLLFGFLFVYRQRDVSLAMIRLGAGKRRVCGYFLCGAGTILLIAAACGALCGYLMNDLLGGLVSRVASVIEVTDLRFSNAALSVVKSLPFTPSVSSEPFFLAALAAVLFGLLFCLLFVFGTFRRKRLSSVRAAGSMRAGRKTPRRIVGAGYSLSSVARGGTRSLVTPLTLLVAVLLLCRLSASVAAYQTEYDALFQTASVQGYATDTHGKMTGKLTVFGMGVNELLRSGYFERVSLSKGEVYLFAGVTRSDGVELDPPPIAFPTNNYALETFLDRMRAGPSIVFTNDPERAPEFFYSSVARISYADGYDADAFARQYEPGAIVPCLVSTAMMEREGIQLGDEIRVWRNDTPAGRYTELFVGGSYIKAGVKDHIYCPLSCYVSESVLRSEPDEESHRLLSRYSFDSVSFTLADASRLSECKQFLSEKGFSSVNHASTLRVFLLLDDKRLNDTAETLSRQIRFVGALYPVLYALTGAAGLIASYLLVLNRRREYAVMRALGTPPRKAFLAFFIEQLLLCLPGILCGLLLAYAARVLTLDGVLLGVAEALCWLLGSAAALLRMNDPNILATLHEED